MAEIAEFTESGINYKDRFHSASFKIRNNADAVSHATCAMAIDVDAKCIVVNSISGLTARMVSRFRCPVDIIGLTTNEKVWRKLNMSWGVLPVLTEKFESNDVMFYNAMKQAKTTLRLSPGDNVVMTGGLIGGPRGNTNIIKLEVAK